MSNELASHLIDDLGAMLLFTMLLILASGQLFRAIYAVAAQAVFLGIAGAVLGAATGNVDLWVIAGITILIKAILLPWLLIQVIKRVGIVREIEPVIPINVTLALAAAIVVLSFWLSASLGPVRQAITGNALPVGLALTLLHVINHGVTKALVFLIAGDAIHRYGSRDMRVMKGFLGIAPWAGTLLLMAAFSLAGTPPFSIFMSELIMIRAGLGSGHYVAVAVFLVMVVVIFAGLIHHVGQMVFGVADKAADRAPEARLPLLGVLLLAAVMVLLGVYMPASLNRVLMRATEIILG